MEINSSNYNYRHLIKGPTGLGLSVGGNPDYLYVFCKFQATDIWVFGRTQLRFEVDYHPGVTVSGITIMQADVSSMYMYSEDIINVNASGGYVLPSNPILYDVSSGSSQFVTNSYYWAGFQIVSGGPIQFNTSTASVYYPGDSQVTNTITYDGSNWLFDGSRVININFTYTP